MSIRNTATVAAIGFAIACAASLAAAQSAGRRGMGMGMHYDKATEVTVTGTVDAVVPQQRGRGMGGTHLMLKTDAGVQEIAVGPSWWLTDQKIEFAKGDDLKVVGSSVTMTGQKVVVAREITKGERTITLRDANGIPAWSGRGRRSQS